MSPTVDYDELAADTDGLSGADLQALVYNAHLDVVHSVLNKPEEEPVANGKGKGKAVDNGKGKGKAVDSELNGSAAPEPVNKTPYRQLQPAEVPITSAAKAAFTERIETIVSSTTPHRIDEDEKAVHKTETPVIEMRHLRESLKSTRPSVSAQERARFARLYAAFVSDRDGNLPNGDGGRQTGTRSSLK